MKIKNCYLLFLFLGIFYFASQTTFAQEITSEEQLYDLDNYILSEHLIGLKDISISIHVPNALVRNGITESQLQTETEIRLRRAGIYSEKATSNLSIWLILTESNDYLIRYKAIITLGQSARIERNNKAFYAETWKKVISGFSEKKLIQIDVRDRIGKSIDGFIEEYQAANSQTVKKNTPNPANKQVTQPKPQAKITEQEDSPFTATYVGGNSPPTVEIFNDTDRTMYFDFGQGRTTAYTIPSRGSQKINLTEAGNYKYKATAPRVRSDEGQSTFKNGYVYTWRFYIVTVPR